MTKIDIKHTFSFLPETIFDAFMDVSTAQNFLFRTETGKLVNAEIEPELGGSFVIIEQRGDIRAEHFGTFVEIEKPQKISFVFSVEKDSSDSSYVEIFFTKSADGCQVQLTQDIPAEHHDLKDKIKSGWASILETLDKYLQSTDKSTPKATITKDSQGQVLNEGDSVKTIKDLKVKGSSMVVKRGTVVKNIHLIADNAEEIDCKVDGVGLHLETQWLLKM